MKSLCLVLRSVETGALKNNVNVEIAPLRLLCKQSRDRQQMMEWSVAL